MTMAQIAQMDTVYLTPKEAAPLLGCDPYWISLMAKTAEGRRDLGFPVIRVGCRTKVLRAPFLRYLGWEGPIKGMGGESDDGTEGGAQ